MTPPLLPAWKRRTFLAVTVLSPLLVLAGIEGVLRLTWHGGALPAFDEFQIAGQHLRAPSRQLARRYFAAEEAPPTPPTDAFSATKPRNAFRLFVLGESSAAGFPYPHNGTFSRVLRDALSDVLPGDSVEVVNLGIAATNSYTLTDLTRDVIAQRPDAVLIYAGHNEYYGVYGVGSSLGSSVSPSAVRLSMSLSRLRTVRLLRVLLAKAQRRQAPSDSAVATFMESVARKQQIELGGDVYQAGLRQFRENLGIVLRALREAGVPTFVASIESNVRDQRPFTSDANGPARAAWDSGAALLGAGDSAAARGQFVRARDLDVVRFRAPSAIDSIIREQAAAGGAVYVPVAERFDDASPGGMPGHELFLEHLHPNRRGYVLIARAFLEALQAQRFLGHQATMSRLAPWPAYDARMELTPFDERIVLHAVRTVTTRWPFVSRAAAIDYRGSYRPQDLSDSLAFLVSRGGLPWGEGKMRLAAHYERAGFVDSALAEYRGLVRDAPFLELPQRLAGRALVTLGRSAEAVPFLEKAARLQPTAETTYLLGVAALQARDYPRAIALLDEATRLSPGSPAPYYQLSLAFGLSRNMAAARAAAAAAARIDPHYPGLEAWMRVLGAPAP